MKTSVRWSVCISASLLMLGPAALAKAEWIVQALPSEPMVRSTSAEAISDNGRIIVGWAGVGSGSAFQGASGNESGIGLLGSLVTGGNSRAWDVNRRGQIVGDSSVLGGGERAVLYSNNTIKDLGSFGGSSTARAINDQGMIVGYSLDANSKRIAFIYNSADSNATMQALDLSGLSAHNVSLAYDINNQNSVVGVYGTLGATMSDLSYQAFVLDSGGVHSLNPSAVGVDYTHSVAMAVNESGDAIGYAEKGRNGESQAFVYSQNTLTGLGVLAGTNSSYAFDINDNGWIVGSSYTFGGSPSNETAFLYQNGQMVSLNSLISDPSWHLVQARGINNNGQIVGWGYRNGGTVPQAFVMTHAPEPGSLAALVGLGVTGLGLAWRKRRRGQQPAA